MNKENGEFMIEREISSEKPSVLHYSQSKTEPFEISRDLDGRITRKFDLHIVPWLFGLWLLAFIDRSNIGNARIDGLTTDLGLVGKHANNFNIVSAMVQPLWDPFRS